MSVDPSGPAAEHGLKTGVVILNVGGKAVATVGDVGSALVQAKASGRHSVLMQVKTVDANRFIAVPFAKG
jgi:serine protease Do